MTLDKMLGHAKSAANGSHLILEQKSQRLAQTEIHLFGKTAHVMMALDGCAGD